MGGCVKEIGPTAKGHFNTKILKWRDQLVLGVNFVYTLSLKMEINFYLFVTNSLASDNQLFPLPDLCSLVHITYQGENTCPIKCQQYYFKKFQKTGLEYVCDFRAGKKKMRSSQGQSDKYNCILIRVMCSVKKNTCLNPKEKSCQKKRNV